MRKSKKKYRDTSSAVNIRIHCLVKEKKSKFLFDRSKVKSIKELIGKIMMQLGISSSCKDEGEDWQLRLGRHVILEEVDDIQENDHVYLVPKISYARNNNHIIDGCQNTNEGYYDTVTDESSSDSDYDFIDTKGRYSLNPDENNIKHEASDSSDAISNDHVRKKKRLFHPYAKNSMEETYIYSDDSSIEDVTSEYQKDKEQLTQNLIDKAEKLYDSDNDDDESHNGGDDTKSFNDTNKRRRSATKNELKKKTKKPRKKKSVDSKEKNTKQYSPIQVILQEKDVPVAPGCKSSKQDEQSSDFDDSKTTLTNTDHINDSIKNRILKLLNTGFHENSNENEAKNAMKLAQRLMQRHNINQALMLQERKKRDSNTDDKELLKGGLVTVEIVHNITKEKTKPISAMARWIAYLINPVRLNFKVEAYKTVGRHPPHCSVTFYGIYTNAQLAAYAFKIACERIARMTADFNPSTASSRASSAFTRRARLSYALGIVEGLTKDVEANKKREEQRRKEKLEKARQAVRKGEAYQESDDDDENDYGDGWISSNDINMNDNNNGGNDFSHNGIEDKLATPFKNESSQNFEKKDDPETDQTKKSQIILEELEKEETATLALIDHHKKVAEDILKEAKVKVYKAAKRAKIAFDYQSYEQGIKDAKEIDLDQKAIRGNSNVVKEEIRSRTKA